MLYTAHEMQRAWLAGMGAMAKTTSDWLLNPANPMSYAGTSPVMARALEVFAHAAAPRGKPPFGLSATIVDGVSVAVNEEIVLRKPFGQLKHFSRAVSGRKDPRVLIVAPMSGHYATLLRGTVERLLPDHEVYVTDWRDAKQVPVSEGHFDLNDYIDYIIEFAGVVGPGSHMLAVCQPAVPAYAALAYMSGQNDPATPLTLTMMGGPVDTRKAPTSVDDLATQRPFAWFEQNVIATVPAGYPGAGRKVYPGFLQLAGFMSMNLANHMKSHWELFKHLVAGDDDSADATKAFYEEYRSVSDMTAEFYLQTIDVVFQRQAIAKGEFVHRGVRIDPAAIDRTALLAIEGERDDISGLGQTKAALDLAVRLPDEKKQYYMAEGAGHYGIFNGRKWRDSIAPIVERFIRSHDPAQLTPLPAVIKVVPRVELAPVPGVEVA
ncbi:polyhydroxyalkanoate depolymerase [Polymorphobacter fuscus]|uniref:Polyhydroxyalkanoate depolymerase n=1 Tax=Sandarakinorhabdus fusca TaxID=1439888 RepID=A0A7C9GVP2_9SPHN|nr:polyhydroxyalkanoate depolymerase [Polymorphobacter fuscus]KAB7648658.1 polyhydroxyalkanoate depolymerase [Polymorphobacter fuscus]MQT16214.1 polyhydroxyalkanoate depolymerase [Polymorphobacter fuscus]NJC07501.1 poly(3-hydroxybutyrate) depolymerase [Polymorphobacter fuscus]